MALRNTQGLVYKIEEPIACLVQAFENAMGYLGGEMRGVGISAGELEKKAKLAYDEAIRAVTDQNSARDAFRTRAAILLTAATALNAAYSFNKLTVGGAWSETFISFYLGLGAFFVAIGSVAFTYGPRSWKGNPGAEDFLVNEYLDASCDKSATEPYGKMLAELAVVHQDNYCNNKSEIGRMRTAYWIGLAGIVVLAVAWGWNAFVVDKPTVKPEPTEVILLEE